MGIDPAHRRAEKRGNLLGGEHPVGWFANWGEVLANSSSSHSRGTGTEVPGGSASASSRSPAAFTCDFSDRHSFANISILLKSLSKFLRDCPRVSHTSRAPPPPIRGDVPLLSCSLPVVPHRVRKSSTAGKNSVWLLGVGVMAGAPDNYELCVGESLHPLLAAGQRHRVLIPVYHQSRSRNPAGERPPVVGAVRVAVRGDGGTHPALQHLYRPAVFRCPEARVSFDAPRGLGRSGDAAQEEPHPLATQ